MLEGGFQKMAGGNGRRTASESPVDGAGNKATSRRIRCEPVRPAAAAYMDGIRKSMVNNLSAAPGIGRGEANIMRPKPIAFDIGEEAEGVHAGRRSKGCARPRMGGEEQYRRLNPPQGGPQHLSLPPPPPVSPPPPTTPPSTSTPPTSMPSPSAGTPAPAPARPQAPTQAQPPECSISEGGGPGTRWHQRLLHLPR